MPGLNPPKSLVFLTLPLLAACGTEPQPGGSGKTPPPFSREVSQVHTGQVVESIGKYLGRGYRGWQFYADPRSCTLPLFDLGDLSVIDVQDAPGYEGRFISGERKTSFYNKLTGDVSVSGTYEGFSGEVTTTFGTEALENRHNSFATSLNTHTYYSLTLLDKAPLLDSVRSDLASMEPIQLFEKYGTHYLKAFYLGGRVQYSSHIDRSRVSKNFRIKASMTASYLKMVEGKAAVGNINKRDLEQISTNQKLKVIGGEPDLAKDVEQGIGASSEKYNAWAKSVEGRMSIADFEAGGLRPIYELVEDAGRRSELEAAWESFMEGKTDKSLTEADPPSVKQNSKFRLIHKNGRKFGKAPYNASYSYYYPKMSGSEAAILQFGGDKSDLNDGNSVEIKTTESFDDTWTGKWSERVRLGAFGNKHNLYYWDEYRNKTDWTILRNVPSFEDNAIRFGDEVKIRNDAYRDQYLVPDSNGYLTTATELNNTENVWVIAPEKEE
jgi:hypothetical protein